MNTYIIEANGVDMGIFHGGDELEAANAYAAEVGYASIADAAETLGKNADDFFDELTITEL